MEWNPAAPRAGTVGSEALQRLEQSLQTEVSRVPVTASVECAAQTHKQRVRKLGRKERCTLVT